ncbi:hypothetical protein RF11_05312 [Thelohanellus kitauei]|uniref:Uncharacterized protein n=1 Tax=Thelohanellus kitauei TaxID=669202 RepID=A0A0C2MVD7_THEKT|nr:hypothetical protein RF11_05312 [Thelohanellus kitauei]
MIDGLHITEKGQSMITSHIIDKFAKRIRLTLSSLPRKAHKHLYIVYHAGSKKTKENTSYTGRYYSAVSSQNKAREPSEHSKDDRSLKANAQIFKRDDNFPFMSVNLRNICS